MREITYPFSFPVCDLLICEFPPVSVRSAPRVSHFERRKRLADYPGELLQPRRGDTSCLQWRTTILKGKL